MTVLNGLSLKIKPGEKVGVVGRTGAGKSTLGLTLSRIMELQSGSIKIDGVDISRVDLDFLRSKITVIP
jgi:ATP-binding cassette, subfamily C (CFTR/MRP), member 1